MNTLSSDPLLHSIPEAVRLVSENLCRHAPPPSRNCVEIIIPIIANVLRFSSSGGNVDVSMNDHIKTEEMRSCFWGYVFLTNVQNSDSEQEFAMRKIYELGMFDLFLEVLNGDRDRLPAGK